jgi:hypothetical protein
MSLQGYHLRQPSLVNIPAIHGWIMTVNCKIPLVAGRVLSGSEEDGLSAEEAQDSD